MQNIVAEMKKVSFSVERQSHQLVRLEKKMSQPRKSNKISASNTDHGAAIHDSLLENGGITEVTKEEEENGHSIMPDNLLEQANMMYNQQPTRSHENKLVNLYTPILMQVVAEVDL